MRKSSRYQAYLQCCRLCKLTTMQCRGTTQRAPGARHTELRCLTQRAPGRDTERWGPTQSSTLDLRSLTVKSHIYIHIDIHVNRLSGKFWVQVACQNSGTNIDCRYLYMYGYMRDSRQICMLQTNNRQDYNRVCVYY